MAATLNINEDDIYTEVRALLRGLFSCEVVRGYSNNVPLPKASFVLMNILNDSPRSTNEHHYDVAAGQAIAGQASEMQMQLDFYGTESGAMARIFVGLWRDFYACERMKKCQPLYANQPRFMPLTNEESNYEARWTVTASLSYYPTVTHEQAFVNAFDIELNPL